MYRHRLLSSCLVPLLVAGAATAGDQVGLGVSITIVDACVVHAERGEPHPAVRVDCSSAQPYRVEHRDQAPAADAAQPAAPDADIRQGRNGVVITF